MKKYFINFILLLNCSILFSQIDSTIFGLARKTSPNSFFFSKINPITGVVSNISQNSIATCVNVTGSASTIDPIKQEFYFRDCSNQFVTVNMLNGSVSNTQLISNTLTPSFGYINYNCSDSTIYGLANSSNPNTFYLSKINPLNGMVTNISISSIGTCVNATGAALNSQKAEFYFENCTNQFITLNINTGAIINTQNISNSNGSGFNLFKYNCKDSTIYGLSIKTSPNQVFLAKINPLTGVVTNISATSLSNNINLTSSTIDPIKNQFYFENSANQFIAVDLATGNLVSNPLITNSNGNYFDIFKYNNGCCCISNVPINLGLDQILCENDTLILSTNQTNNNLVWQDNSTSPTYYVTQPGIYWVSVIQNNCINSDSVKIDVISCEVNLEMPNVFTPNNDNVNDIFAPKNTLAINNATLTIFNRWGQMLFQTTDITKGWNGKINGAESPDGTYFWTLTYSNVKNETKKLNGFLTLAR